MESRKFDFVIYGSVGLYAIFILIFLGITDQLTAEQNAVFEMIDTIFLIFFLGEILLRLTAHGIWYLKDPWSFFDATVVIVRRNAYDAY